MIKSKSYLISLFIMFLVVCFPIYSADAYAASLNIKRSSGTEEYENFFNGNGDNWVIEAEVFDEGNVVDAEQIELPFITGTEKFESCEETLPQGVYLCKWDSGLRTSVQGEYSIDVNLLDSSGNLLEKEEAKINVDSEPPVIDINSITQEDGKVVLDMEVTDPGVCSGLSRIEFYDGDDILSAVGGIPGCTFKEKYPVTFNIETAAEKTITVKAYDNLNQSSSLVSDEIYADFKVPEVYTSTLEIGGARSGYVPADTSNIDISIQIYDNSLLDEVTADMSSMGLSGSERAICNVYSRDTYHCMWYNRDVSIDENSKIIITASDQFGNTLTKEISLDSEVDSSNPVIESFKTSMSYDEKNYALAYNNTFIVEFSDTGSGIDFSTVKMDVSDINPDHKDPILATRCTESSGNYICYWENIDVMNSGIVKITQAKDNVGNFAQGNREYEVKLDYDSPDVSSVNIISVQGQFDAQARSYQLGGDYIEITGVAFDPTPITADADLSLLVSEDLNAVPGECVTDPETSMTTCKWRAGPLKSGYLDVPVKIYFKDVSGNTVVYSKNIEILAIDDEPNPNYWETGTITNKPKAIDRQTTQLTKQRMFFTVPLIPSTNDTEAISIELQGCEGQIASSRMINNIPGSKEPVIVLELDAFDSTGINELSAKCNIAIMSKTDKALIINPEIEQLDLTVPLYNIPLGDIQSNIDSTIEEAKEDVDTSYWTIVKYLNFIVKWSKLACNILYGKDTFRKFMDIINGNYDSLRGTLWGDSIAIAECERHQVQEVSDELFSFELLKVYCSIISCEHVKELSKTADESSRISKSYPGIVGFMDFQDRASTIASKYTGHTPLGFGKLDPYENMVYAVGTACVPAVIYNLEKYRQIQCNYVHCLKTQLPNGVPVSACRELKAYEECKYFWGEMFALIPFTGALNQIFNSVKTILSDPIGLYNMANAAYCIYTCPVSNELTSWCNANAMLLGSVSIVNDLMGIATAFKQTKNDVCSEVDL